MREDFAIVRCAYGSKILHVSMRDSNRDDFSCASLARITNDRRVKL